jgi:HK97 family phage major capsid protein
MEGQTVTKEELKVLFEEHMRGYPDTLRAICKEEFAAWQTAHGAPEIPRHVVSTILQQYEEKPQISFPGAKPAEMLARVCMMRAVESDPLRFGCTTDPATYFANLPAGPGGFRYGDSWVDPFKKYATGNVISAADIISGGAMLAPQISRGFIEALREENVIDRLPTRKINVGDAEVPVQRFDVGSTAQWIGDSPTDGISVGSPEFGEETMRGRQVGLIAVIKNKLLSQAIEGTIENVTNDLLTGCNEAIGNVYFNSPGTKARPKGLIAWAGTKVSDANGTVNAQNCAIDVGKLKSAARKGLKHPARKPYLFLSVENAQALENLTGYGDGGLAFPEMQRDPPMIRRTPFVDTTFLVHGGSGSDILYVDVDEIMTGIPYVRVEQFREATVKLSDGTVLSAVQLDATFVRVLIGGIDLVPRTPHAVKLLHNAHYDA